MSQNVPVQYIRSAAAAENQAEARASKKYKGQDVDAIEADVKVRLEKVLQVSVRLLKTWVDVGRALIALKQKAPHGTYTDRLDRLGISKSSADRYRHAAIVFEMLPPNPPAELYGEIWTLVGALEFGKAKAALLEDLEDDTQAIENIDAKAIKMIKAKRKSDDGRGITTRVLKLESELSTAIHQGDHGSDVAIDTFIQAAERLRRVRDQLQAPQADDEV